jgi:hypothetical protein
VRLLRQRPASIAVPPIAITISLAERRVQKLFAETKPAASLEAAGRSPRVQSGSSDQNL